MIKPQNSTVFFIFNNLQIFPSRKLCVVIRVVGKWDEVNFQRLLINCPMPTGLCLIRACGGLMNKDFEK